MRDLFPACNNCYILSFLFELSFIIPYSVCLMLVWFDVHTCKSIYPQVHVCILFSFENTLRDLQVFTFENTKVVSQVANLRE